MGGHVCALQHLGKATKGTHNTFDHVEGGLGALAKGVGKAVGIIGVLSSHATVHASHTTIAAHSIHATTHTTIAATVHGTHAAHGAKAGVGR